MSLTIKERTDRMLNIEELKNEDVSDGSLFQQMATMLASETFEENVAVEKALLNRFTETSEDFFLEKDGENIGIPILEATKATGVVRVTGTSGKTVNIGDIFFRSSDNFEYVATNSGTIGGVYIDIDIEATEFGEIGNAIIGAVDKMKDMTSVSLISNLESIRDGEEREETEVYRERVLDFKRNPRRSGNPSHYVEWANDVEGVYRSKCFRAWNGALTVKASSIGYDSAILDATKIAEIKAKLDEEAPVGPVAITVTTATAKDISIDLSASIKGGYDNASAVLQIKEAVAKWLNEEIAYVEDKVTFYDVITLIHNLDSITSISTVTLNAVTSDIALLDEEVPILLDVNLTEV